MGIMDKIQEGLNKGKDLVNKTMGGQHSAQTTAPAEDVPAQVTDTGVPATEPGTETPVEPTNEG